MLECLNGGKCVMSKYKYECKCPLNVTGLLCNETLEYSLFRQKIQEGFKEFNSSDYIQLKDLVKFVEPNSTSEEVQFEFLKLVKKYLNQKSENLIQTTKRPILSLLENEKLKKLLSIPRIHHVLVDYF